MIQLGFQINASVRVSAKVLDVIREDLVVADDCPHIVQSIDSRDQETDVFNRAQHSGGLNEAFDFKGSYLRQTNIS